MMNASKETISNLFSRPNWLKALVCLGAYGFISGLPFTVHLGRSSVKNPLMQYVSAAPSTVGDPECICLSDMEEDWGVYEGYNIINSGHRARRARAK